jgi:hypothetical protein
LLELPSDPLVAPVFHVNWLAVLFERLHYRRVWTANMINGLGIHTGHGGPLKRDAKDTHDPRAGQLVEAAAVEKFANLLHGLLAGC